MHWIGAQFCACVFMDSRNKSVNMLSFCRNDQKERIIAQKKKIKNRERPCCGIRLQLTKFAVWPRNVSSKFQSFSII